MVQSARDWPWSGYRATAAQVVRPELLAVDWLLRQFDNDSVIPKRMDEELQP